MLVLVSFWYGKGSNIQKKINAIKFYVFLTMVCGIFCSGNKTPLYFSALSLMSMTIIDQKQKSALCRPNP